MSKSRALVFTQFLPDGIEAGDVIDPSEWPDVHYVVWQLEMCPDTSRLHLQGYIEFVGQKSYSWVHENCEGLETAHLEPRRGSQRDAIAYSKKEESRLDGPWEWGEAREQGRRNDLNEIRERLDRRDPEGDIAADHFGSWIRYHRSFREYKRVRRLETVRDWPMELIFIIGPSGTGKSSKARADFPDAYWGPKGKWWDGYSGQDTVVVDEMYGHRMPFTELLQLCDRYPYQVETKGGMTQFIARRIIFTSNQHPKDWYDSEKTHQVSWSENPLRRRIKEFGKILVTGEIHRIVRDAPAEESPNIDGYDEIFSLAGRILDVD